MTPEDQLLAPVIAVVRVYRRLLDELFGDRVLDVRVFGSSARGDADEDSDVDVAVVVRGLTAWERTQAVDFVYRAWKLDPSPRILLPLVWSEAQFEDRVRAAELRIARDVVEEGIRV